MSPHRWVAAIFALPLLCGFALGISVRSFAGGVVVGVCGVGLLALAGAQAIVAGGRDKG